MFMLRKIGWTHKEKHEISDMWNPENTNDNRRRRTVREAEDSRDKQRGERVRENGRHVIKYRISHHV